MADARQTRMQPIQEMIALEREMKIHTLKAIEAGIKLMEMKNRYGTTSGSNLEPNLETVLYYLPQEPRRVCIHFRGSLPPSIYSYVSVKLRPPSLALNRQG